MVDKLSRIGISWKARLKVIATKINQASLYGIENADPDEGVLARYSTAIIKCRGGRDTRKEMDLVFQVPMR